MVAAESIGHVSFAPGAPRVGAETLFDVASLTKPVAAATAILKLVEEGRLTLAQSIGKALEPEFGPLPHLETVDVRHLLTHTSGLPPIPRFADADGQKSDRAGIIRQALSTPLLRDPGLAYTYSDVGYMLLWEVATLAAKQPLADYIRQEIFTPLDMTLSTFCPTTSNIVCTDANVPAGVVHDPRSRALGGLTGHAGLFSTAAELLCFAEAVRTGGGPILSRASVARMSRSQLAPSVGAMSYGWFCAGNDLLPRGDLFSDQSFGHSGFTGCVLLIDPACDASVALVSNRVLNTAVDGVPYLKLRRQWLNTVAAALTRN